MKEQSEVVTNALIFATQAHGGQQRKYSGEPYITHPIEVMMLVRGADGTEEMQAAALMHDVVEDTEVSIQEICDLFGGEIATLVYELTEPEWEGNRSTRKQFERARLAEVSAEAQTIKLADLISNTRSIVERDPKFAKVYLQEKRDLLAVMRGGNPWLYEWARELCDD